jgi:hypothetical protein
MAETEEKKAKPWYHTRRFYGILTVTIGGCLAIVPGAPIIVTIGTLPITAQMVGLLLTNLGGVVFGYGKGANDQKVAQNKAASK